MWRGLGNGGIHCVGSDHAPWSREQKLDPELDIGQLRPGVANLQTMLPLLYSEGVRKNRITPQQFVAVSSTHAAKLFGLYPTKGTIALGSQADLVLWDPEAARVVRREDLYSRAGFSLFEGWEISGWPRTTLRAGRIVYDDGKVLEPPGTGRLLSRGPTESIVT